MTTPDTVSSALERALERFRSMVEAVARSHGLDEMSIDEVVQEVRLRLWKALETGEKIEAAPASYVYRASLSAAVDVIRRRRARAADPLDDELEGNRARLAVVPADAELERRELAEAVARAVDGLIDSRRPVVRMYLNGYKLDEIADLLGWSSAKTRNLLYRGLADLRAALTDEGIGPGGTR